MALEAISVESGTLWVIVSTFAKVIIMSISVLGFRGVETVFLESLLAGFLLFLLFKLFVCSVGLRNIKGRSS